MRRKTAFLTWAGVIVVALLLIGVALAPSDPVPLGVPEGGLDEGGEVAPDAAGEAPKRGIPSRERGEEEPAEEASAALTGTIYLDGAVKAGASLALVSEAGGPVLYTGSDGAGRYEFHEVPPGRYQLVVNSRGGPFLTPPGGGRPVGELQERLVLEAGSLLEHDITIEHLRLEGGIVDASTGERVRYKAKKGFHVTYVYAHLKVKEGPRKTPGREYDYYTLVKPDDGTFVFEGVDRGTYVLSVEVEGYDIEPVTVSVPMRGDAITVSAIPTQETLTRWVSGALVDPESGAPPRPMGSTIGAKMQLSGKGSYVADIKPDGTFRFERVGPGTYRLTGRLPGFRIDPVDVTVSGGEHLVVNAVPGRVLLSGQVVEALTGMPVAGASVTITTHADLFSPKLVVKTDARGRFSTRLDTGTYDISAGREGFCDCSRKGIELKEERGFTVRLSMERLSGADVTLMGNVLDAETLEPVSRKTLYIHFISDKHRFKESLPMEDRSSFSVKVPRCTLTIRVKDAAQDYHQFVETLTVDVLPGATRKHDILLKRVDKVTLEGRVLDRATGKPVPAAELNLYWMCGQISGTVKPTGDGSYSARVPRGVIDFMTLNCPRSCHARIDLSGFKGAVRKFDIIVE